VGAEGADVKVAAAIAWLETLHPESEVDVTARPPALVDDLFRPMTNAERAREFRRRKRESVTKSNAVSLRGGKGGICEGSEKEAEKKEENGSTHQVDPVTTVTKRNETPLRSKRWRRVPEGWAPNDAHRAIAASRGVDFDKELAAFRDHEFAAPKLDADAAFRNWLRRATPDRNGDRYAFKGTATRLMERSARIAAEEGQKIPTFPLFGGSR